MAYHAHQQQSSQLHNMSSSVPFSSGFLGPPEEDPILSQFFQRSLSLPRALGKQRGQPPPVPPPPPLRVASPRGSTAAVRRQQLRLRGSARSRDDLDMEQVLRPRLNAPDVVRSTMSHRDFKYNEHTIDSVLGTPNKIVIPERYIPEQAPELSEEEQMHRLKKAEAIRKMLSETTPITAPEVEDNQQKKTSIIKKKVAEEKRQRDHILQLNQILAKQVMEKSKMVAVRALATLPLHETSTDDDDLSSPVQPLPLTQQRDNFFS